MRSYRDLIAWQKSVAMVTEVYRITKNFPRDELFGLTSQMRRAAVSIPSNIAEGQGRMTAGEFCQFLGHAKGSVNELETHLIIAQNLGYLEEGVQPPFEQLSEVARLLHGLLNSIRGT